MEVFLQFGKGSGPFQTISVQHMNTNMPRSGGTKSGYGARLPTNIKVKWQGRWHRVYVCIYSNSGTYYIGRNLADCTAKVDFY